MSFLSSAGQRVTSTGHAPAVSLLRGVLRGVLAGGMAFASVCAARADLPPWMQHVVGASTIDAALYRLMELPGAQALYPRSPKEAQTELGGLIAKGPGSAELYSLRALEEEQALDFAAAETDWKTFAAKSKDPVDGTLELANFYHRRLQPADESAALMQVGKAAPTPGETYASPASERSWQAFERLLAVATDQALPDATTAATYVAWLARYPDQPTVYGRYLHWLLEEKKFSDAEDLIAQYRRTLPRDGVFPIKATALVELSRGGGDAASEAKALAVYEAAFTPLWPAELVESFYSLLAETHQQRRFLSDARSRLVQNPDDLNALAQIFFYYQQQGRIDSAEQAVEAFRLSRETRKTTWSAVDLYTLATLMDGIHAYPEAARYDYALYHAAGGDLPGGMTAQEAGLTAMIGLLLTAPEQPIELGSGNLSMYRDIATVDRGPGYWNGILSLWFNSTDPAREFNEEEQKAQPYFHRQKAAELLRLLDRTIPRAAARPQLHAKLVQAYAEYGQTATVIEAGQQFLTAFPESSERVDVANAMADAYARQQDTKSEFALYDRMLAELAAKAGGLPLTAAAARRGTAPAADQAARIDANDGAEADNPSSGTSRDRKLAKNGRAFDIPTTAAPRVLPNPVAVQYSELLDRYLGRLTAMGQQPQALALLRRELDRNPGDSQIYERLANFLGQNNLSSQQEEVYRLAMEKFADRSWYDKLARLYLREKKREAFADLTRKVTDTFEGTDLDRYFRNVPSGGAPPGPTIFLQLNLYAQKRFPHDAVFIRNLLQAYTSRGTADPAAWEALLRRHWWESDAMQTQFFDYLSRTGKLEAELAQLQQITAKSDAIANPAASRELAEAHLWGSHFEQSAPLLETLARAYPADPAIGGAAVSVFRSLAYYDGSQTARAVEIEKNLLTASPGETATLATLGDLYAEMKAGGRDDLAAAAPFWRKIPTVHPGSPNGYLQSATIFWDYYQFDDALAQIREARTRFAQPSLYGYEAGAIAEGKADPAGAVAEYTAAAIGKSSTDNDDSARRRLLQLARRPAYRTLLEEASTREVARASASIAALQLRTDLLTAQRRESELSPLLSAAVARTQSVDDAAAIASLAQAHQQTLVYELALSREATLASDPVQKMELHYSLVRSMEGRGDLTGAARVIDGVYRDNPRILGVVRATTDFYWRNAQKAKGIAVLLAAAKESQPELGRQFTLEAANKANEAGETAQGRALAMGLLQQSPFDARYVAAAADSYARAGDDAGLKQFYLDRLVLVRTAAGLTADERRQNTALLRRGLIPALTRLQDSDGAVDQYIAILSVYPEDAGTAEEAGLYALRYGRQERLLAFLRKTVHDSPRDSRFAILLAQTETMFEDLPAAIVAYSQAIAIRKDRVDLYTARAELEQRLQRFDEACADFERLYVLSYKDPSWMVKEADLRARQGRTADVVRALETAWLVGRPAAAKNEFMVAAQLERWNLLAEARAYADQGLKLAGDSLLLPSNAGTDASNAATYARILARQGQPAQALTTLLAARSAAETLPAPAILSAAELKDAGLTPAEWRTQQTEQRKATAAGTYQSAMNEIGTVIATYYTPEQKLAYAQVLDARRQAGEIDLASAINQAALAGLKDREATWRRDALLGRESASQKAASPAQVAPYVQLQRSRLSLAELGRTMEAYSLTRKPAEQRQLRLEAANAFRDSGDAASELRVLRTMVTASDNDPGTRERYLAAVLKRTPATLLALAGGNDEPLADAAANLAVARAGEPQAWSTLDARGRTMEPVWRRAYAALLGLYLGNKSERTDTAFREVLDDSPLGERLGHTPDRTERLAGATWFSYGMRYGVYRTVSHQGDPEDYLPAELERNPASAAAYAGLARAYVDAGKTDAALTEYGHAIEIAPDDPALHNDMAALLWSADRKSQAVSEWREALAALYRIQDRAAAPESFWSQFRAVMANLKARGLAQQLRPEIDAVLRPYLARNGDYRADELLEAVYRASSSSAEALPWILTLSDAAKSPEGILNSLANASWLPKDQREPIYLRRIELARTQAAQAGSPTDYAVTHLSELQQELVLFYVQQHDDAKARAALSAIPAAQSKSAALEQARLILAARSPAGPNALAELLQKYRADPETAPDAAVLRAAARALIHPDASHGQNKEQENDDVEAADIAAPQATVAVANAVPDWPHARAILEYLFERDQLAHAAIATDFLAVSEARLQTGDASSAITLLRRMTALPGDVYANYDMAASLLESANQSGAAVEFLTALAKNVPWDPSFRLRLAEAQIKSGQNVNAEETRAALNSVAAGVDAIYQVRVRAARDLATGGPTLNAALGSAELNLLAAANHDPSLARQPYFSAARSAAAASAQSAASRAALLSEALAIDPDSSDAQRWRLHIFRAAFELSRNDLAAAAIEPVLSSLLNDRAVPDTSDARDKYATDITPAGEQRPGAPLLTAMSVADRVRLADQVATIYERLGRIPDARRNLATAIALETDPARRASLEARSLRLAAAQSLESANAARRPTIRKTLEQINVVRPRLTAAAESQKQVTP